MGGHESYHNFMQAATLQVGDIKQKRIGHITVYDPVKSMVKAIIPSLRDEDDNPYETGWMRLGTGMVGNGWGIQYRPFGGATADNPSLGEQVSISIEQRTTGLAMVASLTFNDTMSPPGAGTTDMSGNQTMAQGDPNGTNQLQPGEWILKHKTGSFFKFYENGDVQLYTKNDLIARVQNDCNLTVIEGDLNAEVQQGDATLLVDLGDVDVNAPQGDITVESQEGSILVTTDDGDVAVNSTNGDVSVDAGDTVTIDALADVLVTAGGDVSVVAIGDASVDALNATVTGQTSIQVLSPLVSLGTAAFQTLVNAVFMLTKYNNHTHPVLGAVTGIPDLPGIVGEDTTVNTEAS